MQNGNENIDILEERRQKVLELIEKWLKQEKEKEKDLTDQHQDNEDEK